MPRFLSKAPIDLPIETGGPMPHILAVINILGGFLLIMAAVDFLSGYPRINLGSALFWGAVGCVLVYNSFRLWP